MAGLTAAVPDATQPHVGTRGARCQTAAPVPCAVLAEWARSWARSSFLGKGPPDTLGGPSGSDVCGVGPAGQRHGQPAGGEAVAVVGAGRGGEVGVGAGPSRGNAAHRHFVWPGWAEVRALDLNAKVCCSGTDKGPIVCKYFIKQHMTSSAGQWQRETRAGGAELSYGRHETLEGPLGAACEDPSSPAGTRRQDPPHWGVAGPSHPDSCRGGKQLPGLLSASGWLW